MGDVPPFENLKMLAYAYTCALTRLYYTNTIVKSELSKSYSHFYMRALTNSPEHQLSGFWGGAGGGGLCNRTLDLAPPEQVEKRPEPCIIRTTKLSDMIRTLY